MVDTWSAYRKKERELRNQMRAKWLRKSIMDRDNLSIVSRRLGIERATLYKMMRECGVDFNEELRKREAGRLRKQKEIEARRFEELRWSALDRGLTVKEASAEMGVPAWSLYSWAKLKGVQFKAQRKSQNLPEDMKKVAFLDPENQKLYMNLREQLKVSHVEALRRLLGAMENG